MSCPAAYEEARSRLFFDPDEHTENTLKSFQEFIQSFQLWYGRTISRPSKGIFRSHNRTMKNDNSNT